MRCTMVATVRLDESHETKLVKIAELLHKKKSDVIRDALDYYADFILDEKKRRILKAVSKVKDADSLESKELESTLNDGL